MNFYEIYVTRTIPIGGVISLPTERSITLDIDKMFIECDGSSIFRDDYPHLFRTIGVEYGSVDVDHFNLPDYRGMFLGHEVGTYTVGDYRADSIINHRHSIKVVKNDDDSGSTAGVVALQYSGTTSRSFGATSWSGGNETRPKNVYARFCVRYR